MIEIRTTLSLTLNSPHQDISSFEDVMKEHYTELHDFFKNQLQQNLILNCFKVDEVVSPQLISSYFATSTENAQAFVDAAFDTSATFCPAVMWSQNGFDCQVELHEVDFDTMDTELLFDDSDRAWSLTV